MIKLQPVRDKRNPDHVKTSSKNADLESNKQITIEQQLQLLGGISDTQYRWNNLSLSVTAVSILINLDLHYLPGGILISIAVVMFISSFILCSVEQRCLERFDLESLYKTKFAGFWMLRLFFAVQIPFYIWAMVLMFQRANLSSASCPSICP
jgi:hypothetical protein